MKDFLVNLAIPQLLGIILTIILAYISYLAKSYLNAHKDFLEKQREALIQKLGIDKYNHEVEVAKGLIYAVEQMGKEFDWEGTVKHAKATELISTKTGLSADDIFNLIKGTVTELKQSGSKPVASAPLTGIYTIGSAQGQGMSNSNAQPTEKTQAETTSGETQPAPAAQAEASVTESAQ